jgi:phosphoribosylformylglycinamidine synthase subunit PurQ / glutaminase
MVKVAVIQYPGSNCDLDAMEILRDVVKARADLVWHKDLAHDDYDAYVLPGGFSYGDYLRAGAIAATSPSLRTVKEAAESGKPVLGICNGFQILVEAGLLPGAVLRNSSLRFACAWTRLRVETTRTPFTSKAKKGQVLQIPIAHNEGRYYVDREKISELDRTQQIVLRYVSEEEEPAEEANPNGSIDNIAGICNQNGNVMGLMPHPERASLPMLSPENQTDGRVIFDSLMRTLRGSGA